MTSYKGLFVEIVQGLTDDEVVAIGEQIRKIEGIVSVKFLPGEESEKGSIRKPLPSALEQAPMTGGYYTEPVVIELEKLEVDKPGDIYEWVDPDTNTAVYVGQSVDVVRRVKEHKRTARKLDLGKWLYVQLEILHKKPIVQIVAHGANKQELDRLELERTEWHIKQGHILLNRKVGNEAEVDIRYLGSS